MCKQEDTRHCCEIHVKTTVKLLLCSQGDKSPHQHPEEFKNTIEQAEGCGTELGNEEKIKKNCVQVDEDYEAGVLPANASLESWLQGITLCKEEENDDGTQDFRGEEELDQQEQDIRAMENGQGEVKHLLMQPNKKCVHAHFSKMPMKNSVANQWNQWRTNWL